MGNRASIAKMPSIDEVEEGYDLTVEHNGIEYHLMDDQILAIKKSFFKRRTKRIPSFAVENDYCRYCRFPLNNDQMTIEYMDEDLHNLRSDEFDDQIKKMKKELD